MIDKPPKSCPGLPVGPVFLAPYQYMLTYVPGKHLAHADTLSHCPVTTFLCDPAPASAVFLIDSSSFALTAADIARHSTCDSELSQVLDWVKWGWPLGKLGSLWQPYVSRKLELSAQGGCLLWGHRVVVPQPLRKTVLVSLQTGHPGIVRMKAMGRSYMWWPGLDKSITDWVASCQCCQES